MARSYFRQRLAREEEEGYRAAGVLFMQARIVESEGTDGEGSEGSGCSRALYILAPREIKRGYSLLGGKRNVSDRDAEHTAIREVEEETGGVLRDYTTSLYAMLRLEHKVLYYIGCL